MHVTGIIAEYNPFHNGHRYHLEEARKKSNADYIVIAMSGNFMQRGTPALLDKYTRTRMALNNGADLVLEIPSVYSSGSAEYFAAGAVTLLDKLGVVDTLDFGSEWGQADELGQIAAVLADEPDQYKIILQDKLRQGCTYPAARAYALNQTGLLTDCIIPADSCNASSSCIASDSCITSDSLTELFKMPNNILGIEYIKCLIKRGSTIRPVTTKRMGSAYHEEQLNHNYSSAFAIREAVFAGKDLDILKEQLPENAYDIIREHFNSYLPVHPDDFSLLLHYKLLSEADMGYEKYIDITPALSERIRNNLYQFTTFHGFCDLLKTKDVTHTRISRSLTHILLNMESDRLERCKEMDLVPYARILGFKKSSTGLLAAIKAKSSIPLISKLADAERILEDRAYKMLKYDIYVADLYNSVAAGKSRQPMRNEYSTPIVML